MKTWTVLCLAFLTGWPLAAPAQNTHTLPLVRPADFAGQESLVCIVNRSATSGTVQVAAIDDTGERFGPVTLMLGARQSVNITSGDLESGNAAKGLPSGVGNGSGSWRLELVTDLTIKPLAYIRTPDGFLTSMHDVAPVTGGSYWVPFFNPASNTSKVSHLRIINPGTAAAEVTVTGRDDGGDAASGTVRLTLAAGAARTLSAQDLERGGAGFSGRLGDGAGKWHLSVTSSAAIKVMSLLSTRTGHLANLSTEPVPGVQRAVESCRVGTGLEPVAPASLNPGARFKECAEAPEMVVVPSGSFLMGAPESEEGSRPDFEGPVHRVTIGYSFAVGVYEVTFDEWYACVIDGGCGGHRPEIAGWGFGSHPVINVSWPDAKAYVAWLSRVMGAEYRLLSESEWEYVARAGTTTRYWWGDDVGRNRANCQGCGSRWDDRQAAPVGSFSPNAFGLYDVLGNVWEWVEDCGATGNYYGAPTDGSARLLDGNCAYRFLRGGGYGNTPPGIRSAYRDYRQWDQRENDKGFRVARTLTP